MVRFAVVLVALAGLLRLPCPACAQQGTAALTADEIMARVAANQDRSEEARAHFVYLQHTRVVSRSGKTVRCEEIADFRVTPSARSSQRKMLTLDGRVLVKGHYLHYSALPDTKPKTEAKPQPEPDTKPQPEPAPETKEEAAANDGHPISINLDDENDPMDRDLVEDLRSNLTGAPSKDGLGVELFPLTSKAQADDAFRLVGREPQNGRDTYHLTFAPKDRTDFGWKGDAWIDTATFEPVVVRTTLSRKVPFAVRALLGTNVPGLGFTIIYAPQQDDVWFPVSFGTEFKLNVLFFLRREITLSIANRDFERTHVSTRIVGAETASEPAQKP